MRSFYGAAVLLFSVAELSGQTQRALEFQPIDAEWSKALQSIVLITSGATSHLRILNPATNSTNSVTLDSNPTSLSVAQDGRTAAVGHAGSISYVDLMSRSVTKTFATSGPVEDLVLAAGWIYAKPIGALSISSGTIQPSPFTHFNGARLSADGQAIYATENAGNATLLWRYNIGSGPVTAVTDSSTKRTSVVYPACDGAWPSQDGNRIYTGCATAFEQSGTLSPVQNVDMRYATSFPEMSGVKAVAELLSRKWIAAIASIRGGKAAENEVFLFDSTYLAFLYHFVLPDFESGGSAYSARGRWIFLADNFDLYVISEAPAGFPGANTFGISTIALPDASGVPRANPACTTEPSFSKQSVNSIFYGELLRVDVLAPAGCLWNITIPEADSSWLQLNNPGFGSGNRSFLIRTANRFGPPRSTTLRMGTKALTVSQDGFGPPTAPVRLNVKFVAADFSKGVGEMIILGSDPPRIVRHQANLIQNQERAVPRVPLSLALSRPADIYPVIYDDLYKIGQRAAVAQDGWISFYQLGAWNSGTSFAWEYDLKIPSNPRKLAWGANGYLYAFSGTDLFSIHETTGVWQVLTIAKEPRKVTLNRESTVLYADDLRFDISKGAAVLAPPSQSGLCPGPRWLTGKGASTIDSCGGVSSVSADPATDQRPAGTLSNVARDSVVSVDYTPAFPATVVLAVGNTVPGEATELQSYDGSLNYTGSLGLPGFTALTAPYGVDSFKWYGRSVHFWEPHINLVNPNPLAIVVVQAGPAANLISDYALYVPPGTASGNAECPPGQVLYTSEIMPGPGGSKDLSVIVPKECWWVTSPVDSWIKLSDRRTMIGPGVVRVTLDANNSGVTRTGRLTVAATAVEIRQSAVNPNGSLFPIRTILSNSLAASFQVSVAAGNNWTAVSNSPWLQVVSGTPGSGNGVVTIQVAPNYTAEERAGTLTIAGVEYPVSQAGRVGLRFYPVPPCRVADTRNAPGPLGQPAVASGTARSFPVRESNCGIPTTAQAYAMNVTIVPKTVLGYVTLYPTGTTRPVVSTMNSLDGRIKANAAIVPAGLDGAVSVFATDTTEVILDVSGYFAPPTQQPNDDGLLFIPMTPCRVLDTRNAIGPQGGPSLTAQSVRSIAVTGTCSIPPSAKAYSTNVTVVPKGLFGYLTMWPSGLTRPVVSTLNAVTGTITANASIAVPNASGVIDVFATHDTDLLIDVNGYFAPPAQGAVGHKFYALEPCRVADSRNAAGTFGGPQYEALEFRVIPVKLSGCGQMDTPTAYSLNVTVLPLSPSTGFGFLTLWPAGGEKPVVSTLNAVDGAITSNAAIVPGAVVSLQSIHVFATHAAHIIFDINGFFAP